MEAEEEVDSGDSRPAAEEPMEAKAEEEEDNSSMVVS